MELITALLSLITLMVFFIMASNLSEIKAVLKRIDKRLAPEQCLCPKCKKNFTGKLSHCPHCESKNNW